MRMIRLNNGVEIPELGLGVFRTPTGEETVNAVRQIMTDLIRPKTFLILISSLFQGYITTTGRP